MGNPILKHNPTTYSPVEGEVVEYGINWVHFSGYKGKGIAMRRFTQLCEESPLRDDVTLWTDGTYGFRLHI